MPYDDLPETSEPLVLESLEEDTRSRLWGNKSPIIDLMSDNTATYRLETPKHVDKLATLPGPLKGNNSFSLRTLRMLYERDYNLLNNVLL